MRHIVLVAALLVVFGALAQGTEPPRRSPPPAAPPADIPAFEEEPAFPDEAPAQPAAPRSAPAAADGGAASASREPPAAAEVEDEVLPPLPAGTSRGPTPQRFDPSEKVRADFPVSFPVDI